MTVADLKKKGAVALNDDELKKLIVHKSVWLQNTVTGDKYMIIYGDLGRAQRQRRSSRSILDTLPSASPPTRDSFKCDT